MESEKFHREGHVFAGEGREFCCLEGLSRWVKEEAEKVLDAWMERESLNIAHDFHGKAYAIRYVVGCELIRVPPQDVNA